MGGGRLAGGHDPRPGASGLAAADAPFVILLLVGVEIVVLHSARGAAPPMGFDRPLPAFAIAGAVPLVVEAWIQTGLQRAATADAPHASPPHYAGMAALALCISQSSPRAVTAATG